MRRSKKVFFLVNAMSEFDFHELCREILSDVTVSAGDRLPASLDDYDLVVLWCYRKIVPGLASRRNVMVFHSSDLPDGKGWAPIYYAIAQRRPYFTITGIRPDDEMDSGDVVVKARFRLQADHTAAIVRQWDKRITVMLIAHVLERFDGRPITGVPQRSGGSVSLRRRPDDSAVSLDARLEDIVDHLKACESSHPAYFILEGKKMILHVAPAEPPAFPNDLEVEFF